MKLTYNEAYDKIIQAYFNNEIKPMSHQFCFCGTLSPDPLWGVQIQSYLFLESNEITAMQQYTEYPYTISEYKRMESALLLKLGAVFNVAEEGWELPTTVIQSSSYEDLLFQGMCEALDVLKEIHIGRGENVGEIKLTKRQLESC